MRKNFSLRNTVPQMRHVSDILLCICAPWGQILHFHSGALFSMKFQGDSIKYKMRSLYRDVGIIRMGIAFFDCYRISAVSGRQRKRKGNFISFPLGWAVFFAEAEPIQLRQT